MLFRSRAFINRIRSFHYHIGTPDYDLYGMNAEIEMFCEKQILPMKTRQNLLLIVEEMLQLYTPWLRTTHLDMTISYSEKKESLDVVFESSGSALNLFDNAQLPDELGLTIIKSLTESIDYQRLGDKNRLLLILKKMVK